MRLLNATNFELREFVGSAIPPYAILSHTWGDNEVTFRDIHSPDRDRLDGFAKIAACCAKAKQDELDWVWIDTCCIDKSSSAELSEAINSMYAWYRNASVCYAYLCDVPPLDPFLNFEAFAAARWFTRGWCLQELLAPEQLEFYARDWTEVGTKRSLKAFVSDATGIPIPVLLSTRQPSDYLVAERMSWASRRSTTRLEDMAYCLIGLFDVYMPLLYGEGTRAFIRLQEEILKREEDHSLFLWHSPTTLIGGGILCDWPAYFSQRGFPTRTHGWCSYADIQTFLSSNPADPGGAVAPLISSLEPPQVTGRGLRISLFLKPHDESPLNFSVSEYDYFLALTFCKHEAGLVAIPVQARRGQLRGGWERTQRPFMELLPMDLLDPKDIKTVYLQLASESAAPGPTLDTLEIKISLNAPSAHRLLIDETFPPCGIHKMGAGLYATSLLLADCPEKYAISIRDEASAVAFVVLFCPFHGPWSCLISRKRPGESLEELLTRRPIPQSHDLSDRAISGLSTGGYVTVATKTRPGSFAVQVALLKVVSGKLVPRELDPRHVF